MGRTDSITDCTWNSAREIQQSEGHGWGPPVASGLSTPLREVIPESPSDDFFPDFNTEMAPPSRHSSLRGRRSRAGTTPSKFPGLNEAQATAGQQARTTLSSRVTPSGSPHRPRTSSIVEGEDARSLASLANPLARLRAGSTPNRSSLAFSPFGPSIWSTDRPRSSTLGSHNSDEPRPAPSNDPLYEMDVKTLSYLGLEPSGVLSRDGDSIRFVGSRRPMSSDVNRVPNNRIRSYSTNYKDTYAMEEEAAAGRSPFTSGTLTPNAQANAAMLAANNQQLRQHNADVQAYLEQLTSTGGPTSRPRAQTAGLLDAATARWRSQTISSNPAPYIEQPIIPFDWAADETLDYESLTNAVRAMLPQNSTINPDVAVHENTSRAIWLGGVPQHVTPAILRRVFEPFGSIESVRVMTQKGYGFVNFESIASAIMAKNQFDNHELFTGHGPTRIAFAKDPSNTGTPGIQEGLSGNGTNSNGHSIQKNGSDSPQIGGAAGRSSTGLATSSLPRLQDIRDEMIGIARDFGANPEDQARISEMIDRATQYTGYAPEIPSFNEPSQVRIHDAPRLRDIRKRMDNGACSHAEIEDIAEQMLPEMTELASDYLGNTVVQKLFEYCSESTKVAMLEQIAPHLAQIGAHKNGTWAAQTIIRVADTRAQQSMIIDGLRPYGMASFLDQYGNYVMQGCLKFGAPANDFLFECMLSQLWPLAEARFGARAMRACLESQDASRNQQRTLAAAVALYSSHLATNSNGALLLTWYLDTCNFKNRRQILAPRLIPHLVQLCTHKVAYMTVLKLINQKEEAEARQRTLKELFFSDDDSVLEAVLKDQACGATFIFKTLTTPFFDESLRSDAVENVRKVLTKINAQPNQCYKRLMEEVGINRGSAPESRANGASPKRPRVNQQHMNGASYLPGPPQQQFTPVPMNGNFETFNANAMNGPAYNATSLPSPMTPHQAQHYQQPSPYAQNRYNYAPMLGSNGYPTPMSAPYGRSPQTHLTPGASSMVPQPGFSPMMSVNNQGQWQQQYGPPPTFSMPPHHQQQMHMQPMMGQGGGGGRRGRVSSAQTRHSPNLADFGHSAETFSS